MPGAQRVQTESVPFVQRVLSQLAMGVQTRVQEAPSLVKVPGSQAWQLSAPGSEAKVPGGQGVQVSVPDSSENVPGAQAWQL